MDQQIGNSKRSEPRLYLVVTLSKPEMLGEAAVKQHLSSHGPDDMHECARHHVEPFLNPQIQTFKEYESSNILKPTTSKNLKQ